MIINHKSPSAPARINEERDAEIKAGMQWPAGSGIVYQTDPVSISLVTGRVGKILAYQARGETHPDFLWRAMDDTDHLFTPNDFLSFAIALDDFVEIKYIESWQKKAAL